MDVAPTTVLLDALRRLELIGASEMPHFEPLSGGISSDIWRVDTMQGAICIKRALPKLRVKADWHAPLARSAYEFDWLQEVGKLLPEAVPQVLGYDAESNAFAMEFLPPTHYPVWKQQLRDGHVALETAAAVGTNLAKIHAGTAKREDIAKHFDTNELFHAMRLSPYLEATAAAHPKLAHRILELRDITAQTHLALVQGDISPKNILVGSNGPVFVDAECAWYGDPAFDIAFCLNHLLLKCLWTPSCKTAFLNGFEMLKTCYFQGVDWEPVEALEQRAAHLLPALLLARVDGKSPVEYLTKAADKHIVRKTAISLLETPVATLPDVATAFKSAV